MTLFSDIGPWGRSLFWAYIEHRTALDPTNFRLRQGDERVLEGQIGFAQNVIEDEKEQFLFNWTTIRRGVNSQRFSHYRNKILGWSSINYRNRNWYQIRNFQLNLHSFYTATYIFLVLFRISKSYYWKQKEWRISLHEHYLNFDMYVL